MSLEKFQQLVGSLNKSLDDNEKLATPVIAAKLSKYIEIYPQDQTLGTMFRIFEKMADNNTLFIRKAELKSLYNKLYTNNTKFAEIFQDELGIIDNNSELKTYHRDDSVQKVDNYQFGDPILANALSSVFDGSPLKMYAKHLADNALKSITSTLNAWHLKPISLTIEQGNEKFLIARADYETPKGLTSFYIPVEINQDNKIVEASVLIGNLGMCDFNNSNIKSYISKQAGSKLQVNASSIMNLLVNASSQNREISDVEIALTKFNASKQDKSEFFHNQIVGQKIAEAAVKDVVLPKYGEFELFEKSFTSPYGVASFQFGEDKVKIGREHIDRELSAFGYKNSQVIVTGHDDNTIFYGVSLDAGRIGFTVPIKLADNKLSKPSIILCNGTIASFNKEGINQLYVNNQSDFKVAAVASPLYNLKPSELINNIKQALDTSNHAQAEDALNVLSNMENPEAYAIGFKTFLDGLSEKKVSQLHTCNMMVKNSTVSQHDICGHTGLPIHKTYIDNEGNCRPLYRKNIKENYAAAIFMNHKIFG